MKKIGPSQTLKKQCVALLGGLVLSLSAHPASADDSSSSSTPAPSTQSTSTESSSSETTNPLTAETAAPRRRFSAIGSLYATTNLYGYPGQTRLVQSEFSIDPRYKISPMWASELHVAMLANLNQDPNQTLAREKNPQFEDGYLRMAFAGWDLTNDIHLSESTIFAIPMSDQSRYYDNLITAISVTPSVTIGFEPNTVLKDFTVLYSPRVARYVHQYTTSSAGQSLTEYSLRNQVGVSYGITNKLSFTTMFSRSFDYTYMGERRDSFGLLEDLTYSATNKLSFSMGHQNGGNALLPNGQDSNITLVNEQNSIIYLGSSYVF